MKFYFWITLVLAFILVLSACKKDHRLLDASVQPEDDLLTAQLDESLLYGYAQNQVSVLTLNDRYKFLGNRKDPVFGQVDVGLYLNLNTTLKNINYPDTTVLDSAEFVFSVIVNDSEGNTDSPLTFSVFPLDSVLSNKRNYTTDITNLHNAVPFPTMPTAKLVQNSSGSTIRVKLDQAFAKEFVTHPEYLIDNDALQKQYKGFYLAASPASGNEGMILRVDLEDPSSGLFFYMRASVTDTVTKTEKFNFGGASAVRFNTVKQDLATAQPALKAQGPLDSANTKYFFVKGLGVTNTKILIPELTSYADSLNFAVNRAEITFEVDKSMVSGGFFDSPPALCLLPLTPAGRDTFAIDQLATIDNTRYGGSYTGDKYTFNITRHVQAIVDGQIKNSGFVLVVANPDRLDLLNTNGYLTRIIRRDYYAEGIVLYGPAAAENAPRLKISFVRLKN